MRFIPTLLGSFHSVATYRQVRYGAQGWGFFYSFQLVFGLLAVALFAGMIWLHLALFGGQPSFFDSMLSQTRAQLPSMRFEQNRLTVEDGRVHIIRLHGEFQGHGFDTDVAMIDTTGAHTHRNMTTPMLITATETINRKDDGKLEIKPHADVLKAQQQPYILDQAKLDELTRDFANAVHRYAWLGYLLLFAIFYPMFGGLLYVLRMLMLMSVGFAAWAFANLRPGKMPLRVASRMAAVALTPLTFTEIGLMIAGLPTLNFWVFWLLASGFTIATIIATDELAA